jgi:hypothetical protein
VYIVLAHGRVPSEHFTLFSTWMHRRTHSGYNRRIDRSPSLMLGAQLYNIVLNMG